MKICYMKKDGRLNEGIYVFNEPNIWSPLLYFRKPKHASQEEFEILKKNIINNL